jgi:hypothetical protein
MLGNTIGRVVEENPVIGISPHVHILICSGTTILEGNNNITRFPKDDSDPIEMKMPHVATSYSEFLSMCDHLGIAADVVEGAIA